jgi:hypothetical protein
MMRDMAGVDQKIYGTKIVPLLKLKTATTITTISAGTTFKSFIFVPLVLPSLIDRKRPTKLSRLISLGDVSRVTYGRGRYGRSGVLA